MLNQPFFQVALPIMVTLIATIWLASWTQNKHLDEMSKRIDDLARRFDRLESRMESRLAQIEAHLAALDKRLEALELRVWRCVKAQHHPSAFGARV